MYWRDNQGQVYGPFNTQGDGFSDAGEVIRWYRQLRSLSQVALALQLGVSRLQVINMENHNRVPQHLSRRRVIAELLQIPPALLGVGVLGSHLEPLMASERASAAVQPYSVEEAHAYLDAAWEVYRLTGSLTMIPGLQKWKTRIEADAVQKGQNLELLHRYEYCLLMVGRDQQDYAEAAPNRLVDLAEQINDADTLSVSLYRRGRMRFEQHRYNEALGDIRRAISKARHAGPLVKGLVLVSSGPVLAHYATGQDDITEVRDLLDEAYTCIEPAKGHFDTFFTGFDESGYFVDRADSIIHLLHLDSALLDKVWDTLDLAKEGTKPRYVRRRACIEGMYAEAAFRANDASSAASVAIDALELAQSVGSVWNIKRIQQLYEKLARTKFKDSSELRKLRQALARKQDI